VSVGDVQGLADALAALLEDPTRRAQMGQAARARVEAGFELGQCVDRFRGIYQQMLATPR
jgi:glycosyltransferase involved in cell wall biosynthesis